MKTGRKVVLALILILLILTAAAYGYGVHYFTDHFLPGSQVNGFNCSYKTAEETENLLAKEVQAYVLTVETRNNGKESITAKEAGLVYKPGDGAKKLIKNRTATNGSWLSIRRKNIHWKQKPNTMTRIN